MIFTGSSSYTRGFETKGLNEARFKTQKGIKSKCLQNKQRNNFNFLSQYVQSVHFTSLHLSASFCHFPPAIRFFF